MLKPTVLALLSLQIGTVDVDSAQSSRCHRVHARLVNEVVQAGCESPVGLCTEGRITGSGFLHGPNRAVVSGLAEAVGLPAFEAATTVSFTGERAITTRLGVLRLHIVGVFDTADGEFVELEHVVGGTDRLTGATGTLSLIGRAINEGTGFEADITGNICLPK